MDADEAREHQAEKRKHRRAQRRRPLRHAGLGQLSRQQRRAARYAVGHVAPMAVVEQRRPRRPPAAQAPWVDEP